MHLKYRIIPFATLSVVIILLLVALVFSLHKKESEIFIGTNIWPGYEPIYLARSLGYLDKIPQVKLVDFLSSSEVIRAYCRGALNGAMVTLDEAIAIRQSVPDTRIVLITDISNGADQIIAKKPIFSIRDLKGKRVAVEDGPLGAYMLIRALQKGGLTLNDVLIEKVSVANHLASWNSDTIDAIVTFEPVASTIRCDTMAVELFSSRDIPEEIVDVLIFRDALIQSNRPTIREITSAWFLALRYMEINPTDAYKRIAKREGVSTSSLPVSYQNIVLPNQEKNVTLFKSGKLQSTIFTLESVMKANQLLDPKKESPFMIAPYIISEGTY